MTKQDEKDKIRKYMGFGTEATFGVDPAWGPNEEHVFAGPREHKMNFEFKFDRDIYKEFMDYEPSVSYPFKIYNLIEYQIYNPKTELLGKVWAMPAEGFDD